ncbi:hypothetical protein MKZ38_006195 [Zalerion maritima]|uniref:C2H2-type domain-containing protein n=1 Tax=Zalerion maritima TaxID=339359 RepID=A0AAD5RK36_9PEZI|nr:hypothetical protein MKZ38_006195 [Zalerion maritima]
MNPRFQHAHMGNDKYQFQQFSVPTQSPTTRPVWQHPQPQNFKLHKRNLPIVPTLPSTPNLSRPGSSGSSVGTQSFFDSPQQEKLGLVTTSDWAPMTPPLSGDMVGSDPMVSGIDASAAELAALTPLSVDSTGYFNQQTYMHPGSSPTTPGLTDAPSPSISQPETFCNPQNLTRALTVPVEEAPTLAPSCPTNEFFFMGRPDESSETSIGSFDFNPTINTDGIHEFEFVSECDFETGSEDPFYLAAAYSETVNSNNKRSRASSDVTSPLEAITTLEEPAVKKVKVGDGQAVASTKPSNIIIPKMEPQSPQILPSTPKLPSSATASPSMSPMSSAAALSPATKEEIPGTPATSIGSPANGDDYNALPGPPPANRRGRKQSFSDDPTKQFGCNMCTRRFRRQEHLKRHFRSLHTHDKPYTCDECGKSFSRSDNLSQHQRTHGMGTIALDVGPAFTQHQHAMHHSVHHAVHAMHQAHPNGMQVHTNAMQPHPNAMQPHPNSMPPMDYSEVMFHMGAAMPGSADEDQGESIEDPNSSDMSFLPPQM